MWSLVSKCNFLRFWPPEKSAFKLMTNLKFSFSESGPGSVHIPPKSIFLITFSNFYGYIHLGYTVDIFGIFYSQWDYHMANISKILKFLTWHRFDGFGWNNPYVRITPLDYTNFCIQYDLLTLVINMI